MAASSGLDSLSRTQIKEAFDKAVDQVKVPEGKLVLITEEHYDEAIIFMKESFAKDEPLSKIIGVKWNDEAEAFWKEIFSKNLSIMLINNVNGDVMGIRGITITNPDGELDTNAITDDKIKTLLVFMEFCDKGAKFFERFDAPEAIHFLGLGVGVTYRRRGFGSLLMDFALKFVNHLGIKGMCVKGEGSSDFSQRIYEQNKFETLFEMSYADYKPNGTTVLTNIEDHKSMKVYGKMLQ